MTSQDTSLTTSFDSGSSLQRFNNPLSVGVLPGRLASSFAIATSGSFTDNTSSNFAGDLSNPFDDARAYVNGAVTLNGTPLFSGFGNGLTLGPTGTLQNVSAAIGNSLKFGRVAEAVAIDIPAYLVPTVGAFDRTIESWRMPLNGAADVALAFGSGEIRTVRFTGGSLNLPTATVLKNLTIVVENGDVNFNGDRHLLENVRLIALNGSVNLADVQGQNLEVYAARSIHMNQAARFGGKSFLGTQNGDVIFNGSTVSSSFANSLKVIANGNIYVNASVNAHASFLASGNFTANYDSSIVGSIRTQGGITFNASVHVSTEIQALIGVIDTGFNGSNPDIDYSRVMTGRDRIDNDNDPFIFPGMGSEHGTHIAGIIGATRDNGFGIDGINDQAPLWLGRAVGSGNWADSLIEFVDAAKQAGQPHAIANLSFDLTQRDASGRVTTRYELTPQERRALEYARQNGVLIVVPSGNDGGVASVLGQASQEFLNIITVGSIGSIDGTTPTGYSNRGRGLNIVAYGGDLSHPVLSTVGNGVGTMIGTSVAAANVTGAASKVWEANPTLNALQVKDILLKSAIDLGAPGWDVLTGNGRLNLDGAVVLAQQTEAQPYNPAPYLIPITWGGEGKVTPIERPANVSDEAVNLGTNPTSGIRGGTLTPVNFTDYFNFSVTNRQEATLDFGFTGIRSNTGLILSLHDSSGKSLGQLNSEFVGPSLPITKVLEPGEYFVKVTADKFRVDANSEYNFRLGLKATNPDPVDPGEPDGTPNPGDGGIPGPGSGTPIPIPTPIVISDQFNPIYQANKSKLGKPIANVTSLGDGITQQKFEKGVIVSSSQGTFVVDGSIWTEIVKRGGINNALGVPLQESEDLGSGNGSQRFENGLLIVANGSASVLKPSRILDEYLKLGGPKGWLGIPKGNENNDGNGFLTQRFENGYIVWNGKETIAYQLNDSDSRWDSISITSSLFESKGNFDVKYKTGFPQRPSNIQYQPGFDREGWLLATDYDFNLWKAGLVIAGNLFVTGSTDASSTLFHYLLNIGTPLTIDYNKYIKDEQNGRIARDTILNDSKIAIKAIYNSILDQFPIYSKNEIKFDFTSEAYSIGAIDGKGNLLNTGLPYPTSLNWRGALGSHYVWLTGTVQVTPSQFTMQYTLHVEDKWDFNPGQRGPVGISDEVGGRLAQVGLAKPFITQGIASGTFSWQVQDITSKYA